MEATTPRITTAPTRPESRQPIDQGELRAILSNLSHELRRPLISLKAGFDLLLRGPGSSISTDERGHLNTMVSLCDDLLKLTRGYLDYAAIVQGSRPIIQGAFTLGAIVGEIDRQFAPAAQERRIQWSIRVEQPDALVVTDVMRVQQILGNLVSNALKYTPSGGRVVVLARADESAWSLTVRDTGPGIPADAIDAIFEPFYRLPRDEHSNIEGSGLGLAICRELASQLQGRVGLDSDPEWATSIVATFPRAGRGASAPADARSRPTLEAVKPADGKPRRAVGGRNA